MGSEVGLTEVGPGEMVTSFRGWDEGIIEGGSWQPKAWQEEVSRRGVSQGGQGPLSLRLARISTLRGISRNSLSPSSKAVSTSTRG